MTSPPDFAEVASRFVTRTEAVLRAHPCAGGAVAYSRAPAVVDVMGGIGEDSGALVLTATAALSFHAAAWRTSGKQLHMRFISQATGDAGRDHAMPMSILCPKGTTAQQIIARCREAGAEAITPSLLVLREALANDFMPSQEAGLCLVVENDFPEDADLGRHMTQAAAVIDVITKLFAIKSDRLIQSRICAEAIHRLTGLYQRRKAMTSLCGPAEGVLLQLRFDPHPLCVTLDLPEGVIVKALATRLARPTTRQRLIETRTCSEMGHRLIMRLQEEDGQSQHPSAARLASITPGEYVARYRDRMPSKITHDAFVNRFGILRGLEDGHVNPKGIYKIRSRAEHHIYENRRVHDFVTSINRARRADRAQSLQIAGELMYASHWSHSQRCGIGGVETDRLVNAIRGHGPAAGLFGAKVTAGGEGGELVLLMLNDEHAHAALEQVASQARTETRQPVRVYDGALPGAESFQAPGMVDPAGAV